MVLPQAFFTLVLEVRAIIQGDKVYVQSVFGHITEKKLEGKGMVCGYTHFLYYRDKGYN